MNEVEEKDPIASIPKNMHTTNPNDLNHPQCYQLYIEKSL